MRGEPPARASHQMAESYNSEAAGRTLLTTVPVLRSLIQPWILPGLYKRKKESRW